MFVGFDVIWSLLLYLFVGCFGCLLYELVGFTFLGGFNVDFGCFLFLLVVWVYCIA